jgi:hypothetical protein
LKPKASCPHDSPATLREGQYLNFIMQSCTNLCERVITPWLIGLKHDPIVPLWL